MVEAPGELHLAVALDGTGWHPASQSEPPGAAPHDPGTPAAGIRAAAYWADLAREAEAGTLDFLTIEDSLGPETIRGTTAGTARLDAVLLAARIAPLTSHIGIIPVAITTHTEPFHVSTAIATLDYVSEGRAGWRPRASSSAADARLFGRRDFPEFTFEDRDKPEIAAHIEDRFAEAADYIEVVRRLWDSWEDDAEIRDVATGRFIDRDKLHYIDFEGEWFSVRGPSITPRPPQGQPVTAVLAHSTVPYRLAAKAADLVFITPRDPAHAAEILEELNTLSPERPSPAVHRGGSGELSPRNDTAPPPGPATSDGAAGAALAPLQIYADLTVFLDDEPGAAAARRRRLDEIAGREYKSDTVIFAGTPAELADLLLDWRAAGLDGFRLRPGTLPHDLADITRGLVPELRRRGVFRDAYGEATLRERLGLPRPASRYATATAASTSDSEGLAAREAGASA